MKKNDNNIYNLMPRIKEIQLSVADVPHEHEDPETLNFITNKKKKLTG